MFVSSREAAKRLGLHPNTLRAYADGGKIELIETKCNLLEKKLNQIDAMLLATDDGK